MHVVGGCQSENVKVVGGWGMDLFLDGSGKCV